MSVLYARDKNGKLSPVPSIKVEGYLEGIEQGKAEGYAEGKAEGHTEGKAEGYAEGYTEGKQAEYDAFWDAFQVDRNEPRKYYCAFYGPYWNDVTFRPKYDIVCNSESNANMFTGSQMTDLAGILKACGVRLDTSRAVSLSYAFSSCRVMTHVPELSLESIRTNGTNGLFQNAKALHTIDKLIATSSTPWGEKMFENCEALKNLTIEGTIGQNGLDLHWSPLSLGSLLSIVDALEQKTSGDWLVTIGAENLNRLKTQAPYRYEAARSKGWTLV